MDDLTFGANLVEAVLWFVFTVVFSWMASRASGRRRRLWRVLAVAFLVFGISDLVEARTGAWSCPVWLLLLKAGCIGVFVYGLWEHWRLRRIERT